MSMQRTSRRNRNRRTGTTKLSKRGRAGGTRRRSLGTAGNGDPVRRNAASAHAEIAAAKRLADPRYTVAVKPFDVATCYSVRAQYTDREEADQNDVEEAAGEIAE